MPEISIIVPVYNVAQYLPLCLDSIMNQDYADFELILVNDGSTDDSSEICRSYAAKDQRIRLIEQKNRGLSCARNAGMDTARGKYICFIDSDDLVSLDYCSTLLTAVTQFDSDFSVCSVLRFEDGSAPLPNSKNTSAQKLANEEFLNLQLSGSSEFGVWNKLYRSSSIAGIRFQEGKVNEDVFWAADIARNCKSCTIVDKQCYFYRQRTGSIMSGQSRKCPTDRIDAGEYLLNTCKVFFPSLYQKSLRYAIHYPWMFLDPIYVHGSFQENKAYMNRMREFLKTWLFEYQANSIFSNIILSRMKLYTQSPVLYGLNAYTRLARVYLYRLLHLDAYRDGHGI